MLIETCREGQIPDDGRLLADAPDRLSGRWPGALLEQYRGGVLGTEVQRTPVLGTNVDDGLHKGPTPYGQNPIRADASLERSYERGSQAQT